MPHLIPVQLPAHLQWRGGMHTHSDILVCHQPQCCQWEVTCDPSCLRLTQISTENSEYLCDSTFKYREGQAAVVVTVCPGNAHSWSFSAVIG